MTSILIPQKLLEPWAPDNAWALVIKNESDPNPLTEEGFLHYEARLFQELSQAAKEPTKELLNSLLEAVDNLSLGVLGRLKLSRAVNKALKTFADKVIDVAPGIVTDAQLDIARRAFDETAKEFASNQKLFAKSRRGLKKNAADKYKNLGLEREFLLRNNAMFMGAYLRDSMPEKAKYAMTMAFQVGISGDELLPREKRTKLVQEVLEDKFRRLADVPETYWKTYSANALNNARTYSRLKQFQAQEGVIAYRIHAVKDSKTSNICRSLNGKVFPIQQAIDVFDMFFEARSIEDISKVSPMVQGSKSGGFYFLQFGQRIPVDPGDNSRLLAAGITSPPFHFNCRSTILPVRGVIGAPQIGDLDPEFENKILAQEFEYHTSQVKALDKQFAEATKIQDNAKRAISLDKLSVSFKEMASEFDYAWNYDGWLNEFDNAIASGKLKPSQIREARGRVLELQGTHYARAKKHQILGFDIVLASELNRNSKGLIKSSDIDLFTYNGQHLGNWQFKFGKSGGEQFYSLGQQISIQSSDYLSDSNLFKSSNKEEDEKVLAQKDVLKKIEQYISVESIKNWVSYGATNPSATGRKVTKSGIINKAIQGKERLSVHIIRNIEDLDSKVEIYKGG